MKWVRHIQYRLSYLTEYLSDKNTSDLEFIYKGFWCQVYESCLASSQSCLGLCVCVYVCMNKHTHTHRRVTSMDFSLLTKIQLIVLKESERMKRGWFCPILWSMGVWVCVCTPLRGSGRAVYLPFSQRSQGLSLWAQHHAEGDSGDIFHTIRAQDTESWQVKFKFYLMLEVAAASNSGRKTGSEGLRGTVSAGRFGTFEKWFSKVILILFSSFILILDPNSVQDAVPLGCYHFA